MTYLSHTRRPSSAAPPTCCKMTRLRSSSSAIARCCASSASGMTVTTCTARSASLWCTSSLLTIQSKSWRCTRPTRAVTNSRPCCAVAASSRTTSTLQVFLVIPKALIKCEPMTSMSELHSKHLTASSYFTVATSSHATGTNKATGGTCKIWNFPKSQPLSRSWRSRHTTVLVWKKTPSRTCFISCRRPRRRTSTRSWRMTANFSVSRVSSIPLLWLPKMWTVASSLPSILQTTPLLSTNPRSATVESLVANSSSVVSSKSLVRTSGTFRPTSSLVRRWNSTSTGSASPLAICTLWNTWRQTRTSILCAISIRLWLTLETRSGRASYRTMACNTKSSRKCSRIG
eukprot:Rmarinus@m.20099